MPLAPFATPSQQELQDLYTDAALAIELDGLPELEHGKYHGDKDGLPIYDDTPTVFIELPGESVRKVTPDSARILNIGKKVLLTYSEACYVIDDGDLSLEQSAVSFTVHKPDDDPEFYLEAVAINHPTEDNPAWTTDRHTDYKSEDDDNVDESELLTGEDAALALRMLFSESEIALEMDPEAQEEVRLYHLMRYEEFVALRAIVDNLSKL